MTGAGFQLFEEKLAAKVDPSGQAALDIAAIIAMLMALLPLIQGCFALKASTLRRRAGNRGRLIAAYRRERPELTWRESTQAVNLVFEVADEATNEDLELFIADATA